MPDGEDRSMTESPDDRALVDELIRRLADDREISAADARERLHRWVCTGTCEWLRTRGKEVGFDKLKLGDDEPARIVALIGEIMAIDDECEARRRVHMVLCRS
jgi:hypothetical protein